MMRRASALGLLWAGHLHVLAGPPPSHFHAAHGDQGALIVIGDGRVYAGSLPPRALRMVRQWRQLHLDELLHAWEQASAHEDPGSIEPLP